GSSCRSLRQAVSAWPGSIQNPVWRPSLRYHGAVPGLHALWRDVTFASRLLVRTPGFTAASACALALAIGANVTVFTLANAFLFKNLPFDDSARIVYLSSSVAQRPRPVSYPD